MCIYVFLCTCMCTDVSVCVCVGWGLSRHLPPLVSTLSFETQSVTKPVAHQLASVTTHLPQESSYLSASLMLELQSHAPDLYGLSGDLNCGPEACLTDTSLTELSSRPLSIILHLNKDPVWRRQLHSCSLSKHPQLHLILLLQTGHQGWEGPKPGRCHTAFKWQVATRSQMVCQ